MGLPVVGERVEVIGFQGHGSIGIHRVIMVGGVGVGGATVIGDIEGFVAAEAVVGGVAPTPNIGNVAVDERPIAAGGFKVERKHHFLRWRSVEADGAAPLIAREVALHLDHVFHGGDEVCEMQAFRRACQGLPVALIRSDLDTGSHRVALRTGRALPAEVGGGGGDIADRQFVGDVQGRGFGDEQVVLLLLEITRGVIVSTYEKDNGLVEGGIESMKIRFGSSGSD